MSERTRPRWSWWYLLLIAQLGSLYMPFYNRTEPALGGIPFFYWFQLAMILVGAALTAIVYFATERDEPKAKD